MTTLENQSCHMP